MPIGNSPGRWNGVTMAYCRTRRTAPTVGQRELKGTDRGGHVSKLMGCSMRRGCFQISRRPTRVGFRGSHEYLRDQYLRAQLRSLLGEFDARPISQYDYLSPDLEDTGLENTGSLENGGNYCGGARAGCFDRG